ncbi:hypothetical protein [Croceicoccus bisphenolivorans]|uniref:hypothetical protein n=1 Tax=Croceicoccus bisphenolivorans TaxID=1783232 RepID=UPI0012E96DCE|nr:hypothetical protein [Croceicoccus bisphenolivorans]
MGELVSFADAANALVAKRASTHDACANGHAHLQIRGNPICSLSRSLSSLARFLVSLESDCWQSLILRFRTAHAMTQTVGGAALGNSLSAFSPAVGRDAALTGRAKIDRARCLEVCNALGPLPQRDFPMLADVGSSHRSQLNSLAPLLVMTGFSGAAMTLIWACWP